MQYIPFKPQIPISLPILKVPLGRENFNYRRRNSIKVARNAELPLFGRRQVDFEAILAPKSISILAYKVLPIKFNFITLQ